MKDEWLNDLRDRMSEFEMDAPDDLWAEIESAEKNRRNRYVVPALWVKRLSAVAAFVLFALGLWYVALHDFGMDDSEFTAQNRHDSPSSGKHDSDFAEFRQQVDDPGTPVSTVISVADINERSGIGEQVVTPQTDNDVSYNDTILRSDSVDTPTHTDTIPANKHKIFNLTPHFQGLMAKNNPSGSSRVSVGVYSSGGISSNISRRAAGENVVAAGKDNSNWEDSPMLGILLYNRGKEITTDIRHRQPLRAGISLNYKLTDRLGVGTGMSYTNLTSDLKSGSTDHYFTGEQKLHYVGIPLNLTYDIVDWKRLQLYVSAGGLVEKCVSGRVTTDYVLNHKSSERDIEDIDEKPFQFSVNTSAGIQLNVTQSIGLYAEPGISYYFNDGTDINTIYKDKPLNFNFNLGVRFTLR